MDDIEDIRWTTLCGCAEKLMNDNRMQNIERLNLAVHMMSSVVKAMPKEEQFRWFAYVISEVAQRSAGLDVLPITMGLPTAPLVKAAETRK